MKILVNTPRLIPQGGVANHYLGLRKYWSEQVLYNPIGKTSNRSGTGIFRLPWNIVVFIYRIIVYKPDIIVLNPSLSKSALIRDRIFLKISVALKQKVVVFIHGFDKSNIDKINIKKLTTDLNKCQCLFLLADEFRQIVKSWGVRIPIHLTTTKVDDELVRDFDISQRTGKIINILFLARITEQKGIYIALRALKKLKSYYPYLKMRVVGDGSALETAKKMCIDEEIGDVIFLGSLSGKDVANEYINADLYLFPTYHEGMPTTVLEAMSFGLPIITRPVGGLCDFFQNGKMGQMIDSLDYNDFADAVELLLNDEEKVKTISITNYKYAKEHFMASKVAKDIEETLRKYL